MYSLNKNQTFCSPWNYLCFSFVAAVPDHAEPIPTGQTCKVLSQAARQNEIYVIGGSFPEKDGDKLYNTSTVWNPNGELIAKHRKVLAIQLKIKLH